MADRTDTAIPETPPLTDEQVQALPDDTPVVVIWSGGNGPHRYWIVRQGAEVYAARNLDPDDNFRFYNPLTFVGTERFHTRVWLAENGRKDPTP